MASTSPNFLFIINPAAGRTGTDWHTEIKKHLEDFTGNYELLDMPDPCNTEALKKIISKYQPERVIAVGGDGTIKAIAEALVGSNILLGIIPGGSANGMARELNIPTDIKDAIEIIKEGNARKIHLIKVNGEYCIHLSDIGFNALVVKRFQDENKRGMWGYVKAAWKTLRQHSKLKVEIKLDTETTVLEASMVVVANATRYGNGVVINPEGSLFDKLFEVVVIRKISFREIFKMRFTQKNFNEEKTLSFQTTWLNIVSKHKAHFQVDGEYRGKINQLHAELFPEALTVIIASEKKA